MSPRTVYNAFIAIITQLGRLFLIIFIYFVDQYVAVIAHSAEAVGALFRVPRDAGDVLFGLKFADVLIGSPLIQQQNFIGILWDNCQLVEIIRVPC